MRGAVESGRIAYWEWLRCTSVGIKLWHWLLASGLVPASSVLGLLRPMIEVTPQVFPHIWTANVWGDLVFTLGTIGLVLGCLQMARPPQPLGASMVLGFVVGAFGAFVVYGLAFTFTNGPFFDAYHHSTNTFEDVGQFFALRVGDPNLSGVIQYGVWGELGMGAAMAAALGLEGRQRRLAENAPRALLSP